MERRHYAPVALALAASMGLASNAQADIILRTEPSDSTLLPGQHFMIDVYADNRGEAPRQTTSATWAYEPSFGTFTLLSAEIPSLNDFFGGIEMLVNSVSHDSLSERVVDIALNPGPIAREGYLARLHAVAGSEPGVYGLSLLGDFRDERGLRQNYTLEPRPFTVIPSPSTGSITLMALGVASVASSLTRRKR